VHLDGKDNLKRMKAMALRRTFLQNPTQRIRFVYTPKHTSWLNAIEPKWVHGKRKVVEFDGLLGTYELADRVCGAFGCPHHEHLTIPQEVA
jgi:hypothetical protein